MVDKTAAKIKINTGISSDLFILKDRLFPFIRLSSAAIAKLNITKNEPVIINALIFTRSTGFSKYIVIAKGTLIISRTKK